MTSTTNTHNVYMRTGLATEEQILPCIRQYLRDLDEMFPGKGYHPYDPKRPGNGGCQTMISVVTRGDKPTGTTYLWVSNPEVYYIMCGYEPNGALRNREVTASEDLGMGFLEMDLIDIFDRLVTNAVTVERNLGPILNMRDYAYKYTERQREEVTIILQEEEKKKAEAENRDPVEVEAPIHGTIAVGRGTTLPVGDDKIQNKLFGVVDSWVTLDMLHSVFDRFNTLVSPEMTKTDKGFVKKNTGDVWPKIKMEDTGKPGKRNVTVEYSLGTKSDGSFALQLSRKTNLRNPADGRVYTFVFDHHRKFPQKYDNDRPRPNYNAGREFLNRAVTPRGAGAGFGAGSSPREDGFTTVGRRR